MSKLKFLYVTFVIAVLCVGYTLNGALYLTVVSNLGEQTIYIPVSYMENSFCLDDAGVPVNITGSSITGYTLDSSGNRDYRITINPYGETWTYRDASGSGYTTYDYTVTSVIDTNVNFVTMESLESNKINYDIILIGLIMIGGILCFMKTS